MADGVTIETHDGVAHVQLNRPEKKNALIQPLFEELLDTAPNIADDVSVRAVVLPGTG